MGNLENARDLGQGIYTKTEVDAAIFTSSTYFDQGAPFGRASANVLSLPDLAGAVNGTLVEVAEADKDLNTAGSWDVSTFATASNRAGKDMYVYLLEAGGVILSNNSTVPTGYTSTNSRKIGGFHTLCTSVGTISGHPLTGYTQGDLLPNSVWSLQDRSKAGNEGMTKSYDGQWIDIYLPSWNGTKLVSVFGGTIADGGNGWHGYKFEQRFGMIGKKLIKQTGFVVASLGSNQGTNITGSSDPVTTGGHSDTSGRRMISDIGCEDMCGALWQWCSDTGGVYSSGTVWASAFDGNDSGVGGQHYQAPYRGILGGYWKYSSKCGSRGSDWDNSPLALASGFSARAEADGTSSKF